MVKLENKDKPHVIENLLMLPLDASIPLKPALEVSW